MIRTCPRCDFTTNKRSTFEGHVKRKYMCKFTKEDINFKDPVVVKQVLQECPYCDIYQPDMTQHLTVCKSFEEQTRINNINNNTNSNNNNNITTTTTNNSVNNYYISINDHGSYTDINEKKMIQGYLINFIIKLVKDYSSRFKNSEEITVHKFCFDIIDDENNNKQIVETNNKFPKFLFLTKVHLEKNAIKENL